MASKSFGGLHGLLYGNVPDSLTFSPSEVLCEKEKVVESGLRDYLQGGFNISELIDENSIKPL